jgi:hypothetical protein
VVVITLEGGVDDCLYYGALARHLNRTVAVFYRDEPGEFLSQIRRESAHALWPAARVATLARLKLMLDGWSAEAHSSFFGGVRLWFVHNDILAELIALGEADELLSRSNQRRRTSGLLLQGQRNDPATLTRATVFMARP